MPRLHSVPGGVGGLGGRGVRKGGYSACREEEDFLTCNQ